MKIKKVFLLLMVVAMANVVYGQENTRLEFEIRPNQPKPEIVPVDENGFIIFNPFVERKDGSDANFDLSYYDATFEKIWDKKISFDRKLNLEFYEYFEDGLYMIFNNPSKDFLEIISIKIPSGFVNNHEFYVSKGTTINDFVVKNDKVYIVGSTKRTPLIQQLDLATNKIITMPSIVEGKDVEVNEIFINEQTNQVSAVIISSFDKTKNAVIRSFSEQRNKFDDLIIKSDKKVDFHTAKVSSINKSEKLVMGSYGFRNSANTQGFYMAKFTNDEQEFLKFYSFTDLNNFFSFMDDRAQNKVEEKAERKKQKGKDLKIQYRLLMHEIEERNGQYIMVGEAYYPVYRRERYIDYYGYNRTYNYRVIFDGNQFTHAVIAGFDKKGELMWDQSFKIDDIKTMNLKEKVKTYAASNEITLFYNYEGEIRKLKVHQNKVDKVEESHELTTAYSTDKVKRADIGAAEYWYDNYFIAWGYQKIKNENNQDIKRKRNIFYINKMSF